MSGWLPASTSLTIGWSSGVSSRGRSNGGLAASASTRRAAADTIASVRVAGTGAFGSIFEGQDQRAVREPAAEGECIDFAYGLDPEPPGPALISERAIDESVRDHPMAGFQRRLDRFRDM